MPHRLPRKEENPHVRAPVHALMEDTHSGKAGGGGWGREGVGSVDDSVTAGGMKESMAPPAARHRSQDRLWVT